MRNATDLSTPTSTEDSAQWALDQVCVTYR